MMTEPIDWSVHNMINFIFFFLVIYKYNKHRKKLIKK